MFKYSRLENINWDDKYLFPEGISEYKKYYTLTEITFALFNNIFKEIANKQGEKFVPEYNYEDLILKLKPEWEDK